MDVAFDLKRKRALGEPHAYLRDKVLAMLFFFSSTRTRGSFEAGIAQLGGHGAFIESKTPQISHGDTPKEIGEIFGRYFDGIAIRHVDWKVGNRCFGHRRLDLEGRVDQLDRIAARLVERCADVNAREMEGLTPLHVASDMGARDVVRLLLRGGADVFARDARGMTPRSLAERRRYREIEELIGSLTPSAGVSITPTGCLGGG